MARLGLPNGPEDKTVLWLPFRDGAVTDGSALAQTVTRAGTVLPTYGAGYFGDGLQLGVTGDSGVLTRLEVTGSASLNFSGSFTIEFWFLPQKNASLPVVTRLDQTGSQNNAYSIYVSPTTIVFKVWNLAQTSQTLTGPARAFGTVYRWQHVRCQFSASAGLYIFADGALVAYETSALANVASSSLGELEIGGTTANGANGDCVGIVSDIRIRTGQDLSLETLSPNIRPTRTTRRHWQTLEIDLEENIKALSWTDAGGYWHTPTTSIDLRAWMITEGDIRSVKTVTAVGVERTHTQGQNLTDITGHTVDWFWDRPNSKLYFDEDPAGFSIIRLTVRARMADHGCWRGNRYYLPVLTSSKAPERRLAWYDEPYPTGAGDELTIAKADTRLPTAWLDESASKVAWIGRAVRLSWMSDHLAWSARLPVCVGFADEPPTDDEDTARVKVQHEGGRFFRLRLSDTTADEGTYPYVYPGHSGQPFPWIWGKGHQRVPCVCIDKRWLVPPGGGSVRTKWKVAAHRLAAITRVYFGNAPWNMTNVDLDDATFYIAANPDLGSASVDCAGYASSVTDPTSTPGIIVLSWGDPAEAELTPKDILQNWLTLLLGVTTYGTTWAGTDVRAQVNWRMAEQAPDPGSTVTYLQRFLFETLTFLYFGLGTSEATPGLWEWEDTNKADAVDATVYDWDVIEERHWRDRSRLAKKAVASAYTYAVDPAGAVKKGQGSVLALTADSKYDVREQWSPVGGDLTGFYTVGGLDTWLGQIDTLLETPEARAELLLSAGSANVEQFHVLDLQTAGVPSGGTTRYRVVAVQAEAVGVRVHLASEELAPTDGTSTENGRLKIGPQTHARYGDAAGTALVSTAGVWTQLGTWETLFRGDLAYPTGVTHRLLGYGVRVGGAANTDMQVRLYDATNAAAIATLTLGFGTVAGFSASTTFVKPTTACRVILQTNLLAGVTGTLNSVQWMTDESATTTPFVAPGPSQAWSSGGDTAGVSLTTANAWSTMVQRWGVKSWLGWPPNSTGEWTVDCDRNGATTVQFRIIAYWGAGGGNILTVLATSSTISTGGRQLVTMQGSAFQGGTLFVQYYKTGGSNPIFYCAAGDIMNPIKS